MLDADGRRLADQLRQSQSWRHRFALVDWFLLGQLAVEVGYADQAHLIRDFTSSPAPPDCLPGRPSRRPGMAGTRSILGIKAALELTRAAAGDKNVGIWGGANIIREYLRAGLLDEMQIHLIPILLGDGIRLFEDLGPDGIELRRTSSIETPGATHLRFEVVK